MLLTQGERILRLGEMCRKLETEEEKVLPFFAPSLSEEEQEQVAIVENEPGLEALIQVRQLQYSKCTVCCKSVSLASQ